jgi:signal transduction histidine kinase
MRERFHQTLPWLVLALLLSATWWGWQDARSDNERVRRRQFQRIFHQTTAAIADRLDSYSDAHYGGAALFRHSEIVTRDEWRDFVESLHLERRHPGVDGVGHIAVVEAGDLVAFERQRRLEAYPEFRVRSTGERERYYPISLIEPIEQNAGALGLDLGSETGALGAMERARDAGAVTLSRRVILIRDPRHPAGFVMFHPLYGHSRPPETVAARRRDLTGWLFAPFAAQDFIEGLFATTLAEIRSQISLAIYAGEGVSEEALLYRDPSATGAVGEDADGLRVEKRLEILGQTWTAVARPGADFASFVPPRNAPLVLVGGLVISFALFGLFSAVTRTRSRALALARRMTRDLEARTAELELSNRDLELAVRAAESAADALLEQHETLARTDRMAAVGEMAGGLAHEIRNPLAGIQMSLENLRKDAADPEIRERIEPPIAELGRLARLLNRYLSPLRHAPEAVTSVHLRELVEDLCTLLRYRLPENVSLASTISDDITWMLPRDRIRQSLLNLVLNAIHAIGDAEGKIAISAERDEERLAICVDDDGTGFPEDLLKGPLRRFETHREEGTGLGLAMVRRVAEDLGGELILANRDPRGARVRLVLPAQSGERTPGADSPASGRRA